MKFGWHEPVVVLLLSGLLPAILAGKNRLRGNKWWSLVEDFQFPPSSTQTNNIYSIPDSIYKMDKKDPSFRLLTKKQRRIVTTDTGSIVAVAKSSEAAIKECKYQFAQRRWLCPTLSLQEVLHGSNNGGTFGKIIQLGCRETAFVYALTSAALTHSVAQACTEQIISTCTCEEPRSRGTKDKSEVNWRWGGCSDNLRFATKFARRFISDGSSGDAGSADGGTDIRHLMNRHNNEAGRKNVQETATKMCTCQGTSGSCTVQTCWNRLPPFREVGNALKKRFDGASRVVSVAVPKDPGSDSGSPRSRRQGFQPVSSDHKQPKRLDLVYYEKSPNFCTHGSQYNLPSPKGRECNATSHGIDGCDLLCCGRGYREEAYISADPCHCVFEWCCDVKCDVCHTKKTRHVCK